MKNTICIIAFGLIGLCGCEEPTITSQQPTAGAARTFAPGSVEGNIIKKGPQTLPPPTITKQTFIPAYPDFAETKCQAWRITWPTYPADVDPNQIPTVFTVSNGLLNSFNFLNNTSPATTYKTTFNLYNKAKVEASSTLWAELTHAYDGLEIMEMTRLYKANYSVGTIEYMVKQRPSLFQSYWNAVHDVENIYTEFPYQQGSIFLFKLEKQNRYGGIRVVSMTPRIIEVYFAEPNV